MNIDSTSSSAAPWHTTDSAKKKDNGTDNLVSQEHSDEKSISSRGDDKIISSSTVPWHISANDLATQKHDDKKSISSASASSSSSSSSATQEHNNEKNISSSKGDKIISSSAVP